MAFSLGHLDVDPLRLITFEEVRLGFEKITHHVIMLLE